MSEIKTLTINGQSYTVADPDAAHIDDTAVGDKAWSSKRITQAIGQVDGSCAIVCQATGQPICVSDAAERPLKNLTIYGKTTQNGTPTPQSPVPLESTGASGSIGVKVLGKNLLPYPFATENYSAHGITFTDNKDGTVTVNGTATADVHYRVCSYFTYEAGVNYTLSGCPAGGGTNAYCIYIEKADNETQAFVYRDLGNGVVVNFAKGATSRVYLKVSSGTTANNLVFKPQIELGTAPTAYEPYRAPQTLTVATPGGLNGVGDVRDYIDSEKGVYVKPILKHIVSAADTIYDHSNGNIYLDMGVSLRTGTGTKSMCSISGFYTGGTGVYFYPQPGLYSNAAEFKAYAQSHTVELLLMLAQPEETPLSAVELSAFAALHTNRPNTTVTNDAGADMAVQYIADTKLYIDHKIAELQNAILSAGANV